MKAPFKLVLCLFYLVAISSRAQAAFVMNHPLNLAHTTQWLSLGAGAGVVLPYQSVVYGFVQNTYFDHIHLAYAQGVGYHLASGSLNGQLALIQGLGLGYHLMFNAFGLYIGWHSEQTSPGSPAIYHYANQSVHAYGLAKIGEASSPNPSIVYVGFRSTQFTQFTFKTGDRGLLQLVAGTHFCGSETPLWLNNVFTEITVEMSDYGTGSGGENIFGFQAGIFI